MGARRGNLARILAERQCSKERANTLEQPIDKSGCNGFLFLSNEIESTGERSDPNVVDQNVMLQGHRDGQRLFRGACRQNF